MVNSKFKKSILILILSVAIFSFLFFLKNGIYVAKLMVDQQCSQPAIAQLFYDVGNGYSESDSIRKEFSSARQLKKFTIYSVSPILSIRYDPTHMKDDCRIYTIALQTKSNATVHLDLKLIQSIAGANISLREWGLFVEAKNSDPMLSIASAKGFSWQLDLLTFAKLSILFKVIAFILLITTFIIFLLKFLTKRIVKEKSKKFINNYPIRSIFIVSLLSVIVSNYPVIFFNKSFVSPVGISTLTNNGSWIKGFKWNGKAEDFRGSDIGAMDWAIKPNSNVSGDSFFKYHEFPFYNRYVGAGVPLYGQANNLIGDPLNLIPYFFNNPEVGWDVKFIFSRFLFVFGVGVLLLKLKIANINSVLLATFSSSFLGYFAFRFNHPAVFCLTYSPWLLLSWINFSNTSDREKFSSIARVISFFVLASLSLLMINSGPIKETLIFTSYIHFVGGMAFLSQKFTSSLYYRIAKLLLIYLAIALIYSHYLLNFLDALKESYTVYDNPAVNQLTWGHLLGIFNISYSPTLLVSTNLFFLFGTVSFFYKRRLLDSKQKAILYPAFLSFLIVYAVIPADFLIKIPFLCNINHVWNVFSIPIMFSIIIISAIGFTTFMEGDRESQKCIYRTFVKTYCILFLFAAIYFSPGIAFYLLFFFSLLIFLLVFKYFFHVNGSSVSVEKVIIFCLILVLPEGQHLMTNIKVLDKNIVNPMPRGDESRLPDSIIFIKEQTKDNPSRVIGESETFFPGYNSQLGLESIVSVEPLRNKRFEHLLDVIEYPDSVWGWLRLVKQDQFDFINHGLSMLGVGYVLAKKGTHLPSTMTLAYEDTGEFDVWKNPKVWPRAFFTNNLKIYKSEEEFRRLLKEESGPFVALDEIPSFVLESEQADKVLFSSAKKYHLTNNKTEFDVDVPDKGFVVLSSAYYPEDFIVTINGKRTNYFPVNMAFIGSFIDKPGNYHFVVEYHPKRFNLYLWSILVGFAIGLLTLIDFTRFTKRV